MVYELNICKFIQADFLVEQIHVWRLVMCGMLQYRRIKLRSGSRFLKIVFTLHLSTYTCLIEDDFC